MRQPKFPAMSSRLLSVPSKAGWAPTTRTRSLMFRSCRRLPTARPMCWLSCSMMSGSGMPALSAPVNTPTLQRLADEGLRYNRFHTTAPARRRSVTRAPEAT